MADTTVSEAPVTPTVAPAPVASATPVPVTQVPSTQTAPAPQPAATQPATVPTTPEKAAEEPSLLGAAKEEPKPGEVAPVVQSVPEKYSDFALPEGVQKDEQLLEKATPVFKELGLSQEAAQKLVTLQAEGVKAGQEALVKAAEAQRVAFLEAEKQTTLKALGVDYQKELGYAAKALDKFGDTDLRKLMDQTGFGMNLKMVQFCIAVGKAMAEDTMPGPISSGTENGEKKALANMFPSMHDGDGNTLAEFSKK